MFECELRLLKERYKTPRPVLLTDKLFIVSSALFVSISIYLLLFTKNLRANKQLSAESYTKDVFW